MIGVQVTHCVMRFALCALRFAHCAGRDVREQLMNRREQYIIDPVAALRFSVSELPSRGHES